MSSILLVQSGNNMESVIGRILTAHDFSFACLDDRHFQPEFLASEHYDMIIFDCPWNERSCVRALDQLETWTTVSGVAPPPLIVVAENGESFLELAVRKAQVDFFFVKPVLEADLVSAIISNSSRGRMPSAGSMV